MLVYLARNLINGKIYIGYTALRLEQRFQDHCQMASYGSPSYFHRAIRKYGKDSFALEILAETETTTAAKDSERAFINLFKSNDPQVGYNMTGGGDGITGYVWSDSQRAKMRERMIGNKNCLGFKHTPETRRKMSESGKGRRFTLLHRLRIGLSNRGRIQTEETKRKVSIANKGMVHPEIMQKLAEHNRGSKRSDETREKIRQAALGRRHSEATRRKISNSRKGSIPWNRGLRAERQS